MNSGLIRSQLPVLLVGGGDCPPEMLAPLLERCPVRVGADGGGAALLAAGVMPDAVIGDLDSLGPDARARIPAPRIHHIAEQNSTDFDKCLRNIDAPLVYAAGFLGARLDHQLSAMTVLVRRPERPCLLVGREDVVALCPPELALELPLGTRASLFPMAEVGGHSRGLRWPIDGLRFTPDRLTGTSNETDAPRVELRLDAPKMLVILPVQAQAALERGLLEAAARWPARA
ncbi:thiamine diphosphokinase [Salipiger mangrovisoli]|uniref:Thiamine diphosphokinase n=1 Tax=Salipiger mangrovisoli TaxID=2865933 RepID=A0ABR9WZ02_9RHOB|nr:thiamine diphosphokinase [Salipiger mangrovisoli]MBE9636516.1 thiamine diphosphokinase [Salipiger mangrovisoli]